MHRRNLNLKNKTNESRREKTCCCFLLLRANNVDDQPAHPRSQISAFVIRYLASIIYVNLLNTKLSIFYLVSGAEQTYLVRVFSRRRTTIFMIYILKTKRNFTLLVSIPFSWIGVWFILIVGEPKSRIVQKHTFFAPERYTAGILYNDSLISAWYETTV